jgi:hypothetical protein
LTKLTNRDGSICSKEHTDNFILDAQLSEGFIGLWLGGRGYQTRMAAVLKKHAKIDS